MYLKIDRPGKSRTYECNSVSVVLTKENEITIFAEGKDHGATFVVEKTEPDVWVGLMNDRGQTIDRIYARGPD